MSDFTEMLIPAVSQSSSHFQLGPSLKPKIVVVPIQAFHSQHCQELLRPSLSKKSKPRIEGRWDHHILPCGRRIESMNRQTRCTVSVVSLLLVESGATCSASNTLSYHGAALSASSLASNDNMLLGIGAPSISSSGSFNMAFALAPQEEGPLVSSLEKHNLASFVGTVQNAVPCATATVVGVSIEMGKLAKEEAEKRRREEMERLRRKKISEANRGRAPWNKGRRGGLKALDGGAATWLRVISPEEREHLRRQRISNANRGRVPWNKGGQHSPETKQRIRIRVIEAMKDPMIREKLRIHAKAVKFSPEIRLKIKTGMLGAWNAKRRMKARQEICLMEWKEMIAEAARKGGDGDAVYQWDSHATMNRLLRSAWQLLLHERREPVPRCDLSTERRMRISEAIKAKWADPNYRINVQKGIQDSLVKRGVASNPTSTKLNANPPNTKKPLIRVTHDDAGGQKNAATLVKQQPSYSKPAMELPTYKDPQIEMKLEKLKSMRARRLSVEEQQWREITERARVLIAQAEKAAKVLEAAAVKDKNALAPLLETRRLLAEAARSFKTTSRGSHSSKAAALWGKDGNLIISRDVGNGAALSSPLSGSGKEDGKGY